MDVALLGTGSADGWPNPWCGCASCTWMRTHGEIRGQTAALVDDTLLIDCGPEVPRAALRDGHTLAGVRHLLLTHAHPDHTGAAALMWREWLHPTDVLDVAGPPAALAECRRWVDPAATIRWHSLAAGDTVGLGDYTVRAVAAAHGDASVGPALLYVVSDASGASMLWATDTRELPAETVAALGDRALDAMFLEETNGDDYRATTDHLDLRTWPLTVAALRRAGVIGADTALFPIHLSHRNPPTPRLDVLMRGWGARLVADGDVVRVGSHGAVAPPPRRVLVTGGARSGKSRYAESLVSADPDVTYVATSLPRPDDAEWQQRVKEHQARRPATWQTVETLDVAAQLRASSGTTLVECATLWLGALLDDDDLDAQCDELVSAVAGANGRVVVVTNEVGDGVVPASADGRAFRDALGALNARLAAVCDEVWRVTVGIPERLA